MGIEQKVTGLALTFDDVLLAPGYSDVLPEEVDLSTQLTQAIRLNLPVISAAMDTVSEAQMGIGMARLGGVAVIHRHLVDHVHHLGQQRGRGDGEARVLHVVRVGRVVAAQRSQEREDVLAHHCEHFGGSEVLEA